MLQLKSGRYLGSNKRSWEANGVFISETEYHAKVFEGWHYHENSHITLILQGGNREQRSNREIESEPGKILFYANSELHRNVNTKHPSRNINVEIENSFFSRYNVGVTSINDTELNCANAKFTLLKAYKECLTNDEHSQSTIHELILDLITTTSHSQDEKFNPRWAVLVKDILNDRWNENVMLDELAGLVQVHPVTISKFFPKYFRCTLGEYVRKIRVEKAMMLIRKSQLSLTGIAHQCGFFDQSHFIRVFKQTTGFLPNGYKKI
jgi:AraC family transcriptional regulator